MEVVRLGEQINNQIVLCLGFFGSMHTGHEELLSRAIARAKMTNSKVALFTFENNHLDVLKGESKLLYTFEERLLIYESLGVEYVISTTFDNSFKSLTGKQFLTRLDRYDLESVICGFDYCCGRDRLDALGVRKYLKKIPVYIVEQISVDNVKVSTSLLRKYLLDRQIDKVNALLSEPFFAIGKVVHGRGVGKSLGFPTANIQVSDEKLLPSGVYTAKAYINDKNYAAIINIGDTPTYGVERNTFEVHLIDFAGDIYGQEIKVSLIRYLRPTRQFDSPESLSRQLSLDREAALND